jgi:WD40 repeat protein
VFLVDVETGKLRTSGIQGPHAETGADRPPNTPAIVGDTSYTTAMHAEFSADSKKLLVVSMRTTQWWDAVRGNSLTRPQRFGGDIQYCAMHPVTRDVYLISSSVSYANPQLLPQASPVVGLLWNPTTNKRVGKPLAFDQIPWPGNGHHWRIEQAEISPDGKWLALVHGNSIARLFDLQKGKELVAGGLRAPDIGNTTRVVWSPDGKRLVVHTNDDAQLWDPVTSSKVGDAIKTVGILGHGPRDSLKLRAAFSPDSSTLALPTRGDGRAHDVQLIDAATGQSKSKFKTSKSLGAPIVQLQYVGNSFLVITEEETIRPWLWDVTGKPLSQPAVYVDVRLAAVSPDGKRLATFCLSEAAGRSIRIWKLP